MDVRVPEDLWDDDKEGVINLWLYNDGAQVREGVVLAELMVEKISLELLAPAAGRLAIVAEADSVIRRGDLVARIEGEP